MPTTCSLPTPIREVTSNEHTASTPRPSYRVLVIEDDVHIAKLISVNLTRAGVESRSAFNGQAGLEEFKNHPPHLVLLDLMMPVLNGFQVCEKLRALSVVPIVIMTARLEPIHQMRGFRLGADDFVLKPFDPQLLVARVIAHLRRVYRYNNGHIYRREDHAAETTAAESASRPLQLESSTPLAHMPLGWAGCDACNYMAPLSQFPRRFNGKNTTVLTCPHCQSQGRIRFAVNAS
jgi:CheY-like chemotaxis protein